MTETGAVLVIDDSEIARASLARTLREGGFKVTALPSALGATQLVLRKDIRVVVTDVSMPLLRGDGLISVFRKSRRLDHVAIVLVSGVPDLDVKVLAKQTGADAAVSKRDVPRQLVPTVRHLLEHGRGTPDAAGGCV